ncbi:hypothetical protein MSAN_00943200 [Mycena sanguinolenta]|uniref:Uncharacterized protein n=1 Tax=Mycena sanguinolenta TaxID=230812 RepID=A0A8H6YXP3_9AGAR|nr:hypothetical protein MSAN_00943200 [Mycena sanguinolenta]
MRIRRCFKSCPTPLRSTSASACLPSTRTLPIPPDLCRHRMRTTPSNSRTRSSAPLSPTSHATSSPPPRLAWPARQGHLNADGYSRAGAEPPSLLAMEWDASHLNIPLTAGSAGVLFSYPTHVIVISASSYYGAGDASRFPVHAVVLAAHCAKLPPFFLTPRGANAPGIADYASQPAEVRDIARMDIRRPAPRSSPHLG